MPEAPAPPTAPLSRGARLAAAAVHVYTALGSVLAFLIVIAAVDGDVEAALWLGLVALVIDGTDGMLARRARVKQAIPWFDGALLDNIVDYLTYVFAPVVLLWTTGHLPEGLPGWLLASLPLLASCYQFCRVDAKTDDHTFLGFPSYWNVVAFYAIVLDASQPVLAAFLVVFSILVFVPIRFLYPSRSGTLRTLSLVLSAVWAVTYAVLLVQYPDPHPLVAVASLAYVVYYWGVSFYLTAVAARRRRQAERTPA
ncbi:phosphatidylcholine/phosphatidylserine synthase [Blastococcus sp. TF02A-26]|uniref:CDP-alcohol phosphatidyltransferase family protein n=1 Tax=Blastococcus sp. TF02A-26 TaxID=2250577 RepID=UPI000DEA8171|nr:CDP-diacylglycerol O-phosphatidyltransferase [Blastococcus sp. TF02A-26]RBY82233.1 CDP-diacylglycerol O-phosphatidyltransferase [Blastococcus sp. TF02A-26]